MLKDKTKSDIFTVKSPVLLTTPSLQLSTTPTPPP